MDAALAERWMAGKQVGNAEVRKVLANHPMGEPRDQTQATYDFFSKTTHPNRTHLAYRLLGEGNTFVLGAIGKPSLALLADYALKTLNLWFWFGAFVSFTYRDVLNTADPDFPKARLQASDAAHSVARWPVEQYNRVLAEEQAESRGR